MNWERFGITWKVGGEQRGVDVQCASMGAPTALIGCGEEEEDNFVGNLISSIEKNLLHTKIF